jgi:pimeloyl-ACP methyl ester carboxylesterase
MNLLISIGLVLVIIIGSYMVYMLIIAVVPFKPIPIQKIEKTEEELKKDVKPLLSRKDVCFDIKGTSIKAWLYLPENTSSPVPCIIMGHGFGGTKDIGLEAYAHRYQTAGMAALTIDFRHLGESEGQPRQLVWIPYQLEDYAAAIVYARSLEKIDAKRIALWGTSLSGGHVITTAASDHSVACASAQVPLLGHGGGGMEIVKRMGLGYMLWMGFGHGLRDLVRSWLGLSPHKIPLFGRPGTVAAMADAGAWDMFKELAGDNFVNEVCARIMIRIDKYHPIKYISKVQCPVLIQACDKDIGLPQKMIEKAKNRLGDLAEVIHYPIDHFDIYLGDNFEKAVSDQLEFFKKHLL